MNKEELLRNILELETRVDYIQDNILVGTFVNIDKYGTGRIKSQDEIRTEISFSDENKTFDASVVDEKFYDRQNLQKMQKEMAGKWNVLNDGPSPEELIKKMLSRWSRWDKYEDEYLNHVAYELVKYPDFKTNPDEAAILDELKRKLSETDWNKLPQYISDVYFDREFVLVDGVDEIRNRIEPAIKNQIFDEMKDRTVEIINKVIDAEEKENKRAAALDRLNNLFKEDYLGAKEIYRNSDISQFVPEDSFELESEAYVRNWFAKVKRPDDDLPDPEQIAAISTRNKNVEVVARAGSGKTTTIISRTRFLIEHCGVDPSSVLLLAFNRKAVEEMEGRLLATLGEGHIPFVMTFHALAFSIVHPEDVLIFDNPETNDGTLSRVIQAIIDKKIRDKAYVGKIRTLMISQFKDAWKDIEAGGYNLSKEEMIVFRKALKNVAMDGKRVQNDTDRLIANVLFEHDVEYQYRWSNKQGRNQSTSYFVIKAPGNRFAVIEAVNQLSGSNNNIQQKKDYWSSKGYRYYVLRSDLVNESEDTLIESLSAFFRSVDMPFLKLSDEEIWRRIKDRAIDLFTDAVRTFIGRCRKLEVTPFKLAQMVRKHDTYNKAEKLFLEIAQDLYSEYLQVLDKEGLEDFDGLMSRASECVNNGRHVFKRKREQGLFEDLEYILIDEYQDFSYLFDKFLVLIRGLCPNASIFCVGDDWQAINGFAGSDVKYFTGFTERYEDSRRYHISTNYRSVPNIVKSSNALMARFNDGTTAKAARSGNQKIRLGYCQDLQMFPQEEKSFFGKKMNAALLRLVNFFVSNGKSVAVLSRTNKEIEGLEQYLHSFFPKKEQELIFVSTTHKYKGKQKDAIIVIDAEIGRYPLINPAWIFNRIFGDTEKKIMDDERRLFYVAVTRAKDDLILLTTENEESPFLNDMPKMQVIDWDEFPPMKEVTGGAARSHVKVTVANRVGYKRFPAPTYKIKDLLKKASFTYDGDGGWYKFYPQSDMLVAELMNEQWAVAADGIAVTITGDDNRIIDSFVI